MMKKNRCQFRLAPLFNMMLFAQIATMSSFVYADERESLEQLRATTTSLINALVQEGVLPKAKADALLKEASQAAMPKNTESDDIEAIKKADSKNVRVQLVPEFVKNQMREDIKKEVMADLNYKAGERLGMPDWIDNITWEGDMRLRYERDTFPIDIVPNTAPNALKSNTFYNVSNLDNSTEDRDRFRLRARLGAKVKVNDWLSGGVRMTTGSATDPVSPNQTESASTGKYTFSLDRAYLKAKLNNWSEVTGGRFSNPFFATDLVWDPDLAFDGVAASINPKINDHLSVFGTLGAFPIEEVNKSDSNLAQNKWLYGAQGGINWKLYDKANVKLAAAYYDFENVEGISNGSNPLQPYDATAPVFRQKGNSTFNINQNVSGATALYGLASKFKELNLIGQIDLANFEPVHVVFTADYVKNLGFDLQEMEARTGNVGVYDKADEAYQLRLMVGMPETVKKNDWQVWGAYKRLESDSVLDAFTDSDFHLGGTNAKGWLLGASYGIDKNAWVTARWFTADQVTSFNQPNQNGQLAIDVFMLDMNAKF